MTETFVPDPNLRNRCQDLATELSRQTGHRLVCGYYIDPEWGQEEHWWCEDQQGNRIDPTAAQFPSNGTGTYIEVPPPSCEQCGNDVPFEMLRDVGPVCSGRCHAAIVGVYY